MNKEIIDLKKNTLKKTFLVCIFFIVAIMILPLLPLFHEIKNIKLLNLLIFISFTFFIFLIAAISNVLVKILNLYTYNKKILRKTNKEIQCKYCSSTPSGPFICGNCNSILWYNLKKNGWLLPATVFILSHRWAIIAAIAGAFFVGPIYILKEKTSELRSEFITESIEYRESLSLILDDLSMVRSKIVNLEMTSIKKYNMQEWERLNTIYTKIYWNIIPAFEHLLENTCKMNPDFKTAIKETKSEENITLSEFINKTKTNKGLNLYGTAYIINNKNYDIIAISKYLDYADCVYLCELYPEKENIEARKKLAKELFHELRLTTLLMRCLIDSKWLLNDGNYPSEAADPAFKFKRMFLNGGKDTLENSIYNLKFDYNVRSLDAFSGLGLN